MKTSSVTFGSVIAVSGKSKKMDKVNKKLLPYAKTGKVMIKDVTSFYRNASPAGEMAQAAQRGESVDIYITGSDIEKIKKKQYGWRSIRDILGNLEDCFSANPMFVSDVVDKIIKKS